MQSNEKRCNRNYQHKSIMNIYFIFLSAGFFATIKCDDTCGSGGFLKLCGSACDPVPTCENPKPLPPHRRCPRICSQLCSCFDGYVLHDGKCIKRESCPKQANDTCGVGGYLNECASACDLVPSCDNPNPGTPSPDIACPAVCLKRCSCYDGYVLHEGQCIKLESCPAQADGTCGVGGYLNECTSACDPVPSCENPNPAAPSPGSLCIDVCVPRCTCYEGYVLHEGQCIKPGSCPNKGDDQCGPGGHFMDCASKCTPVPTCANPRPILPPQGIVCTLECVARCSCRRGYVLHNGRCIRRRSCPRISIRSI